MGGDGWTAGWGLGVLLLLPGLMVVRAPWTAVPFLSAGFWMVTWWWLPASVPRHRFLLAALATSGLLTLLRLLKPLPSLRVSWPSALVAVAALARLAPFVLWPVGPGADMSLHSLSTLLLVWHDGLPRTYEPLLPIATFGAYTPGLHALAADLALLTGLSADRAAFLFSLAAYGLLQVGLYALLARIFSREVAGLASVFALGMARVPQGFFGWGGNPSVLALAFLAAAFALLVRPGSRASAVAAGLLLAAVAVAHAMIAALALLLLPWALDLWRRRSPQERRTVVARLLLAGGTAAFLAAPFLWRFHPTLSQGEQAWLADHLRTHYAADWVRYSTWYPWAVGRYVIATLNDAFLVAALAGAALALRRRASGGTGGVLAFALLVGVAATATGGGLGWPVFYPERPLAVVFVILTLALGFLVEWAWESPRGWASLVLLLLGGTALERTHRYYLAAGANVMVSTDDLRAMSWITAHTGPLDVICNDYPTAGLWIPALAGRSISAPQLPPFYFDEFEAGARGRTCRHRYLSTRWFFGATPQAHAGEIEFQSGTAAVVKVSPPEKVE